MPIFDLSLPELRQYSPTIDIPDDFDDFWSRTIDEAASLPLDTRFMPASSPVSEFVVNDVSFNGFGGNRINAWLILPKTTNPVGCVVRFIGYGGGRGLPHQHLAFPATGWATLVMDTRGQGTGTASRGDTADPHGGTGALVPGMMTRGIDNAKNYYYRRVFTDAVRAIDVAASHPRIDSSKITVVGHSQGGGMAQAVAALHPVVSAAMVDAPFLTHFRRAVEIATMPPYLELTAYLASHRDAEERTFTTLSYFDGVNFAKRGDIPILYSVALMDLTCPPSTVFAAYNAWKHTDKHIEVYPWNGHEVGQEDHFLHQARFLKERFD